VEQDKLVEKRKEMDTISSFVFSAVEKVANLIEFMPGAHV
jgi:hypothetical protein